MRTPLGTLISELEAIMKDMKATLRDRARKNEDITLLAGMLKAYGSAKDKATNLLPQEKMGIMDSYSCGEENEGCGGRITPEKYFEEKYKP